MKAEEKCERFAADGIFKVIACLTGETNEELSKRRQHIYNQRFLYKEEKKE